VVTLCCSSGRFEKARTRILKLGWVRMN
jgi:hypothetical protein